VRTLLLLPAVLACSSTPSPPDFRTADDVDQRVTAIQALTDAQVRARLADLEAAGTQDPHPRVRDQVTLRLGRWSQPDAIPILGSIYRSDAHADVARAALLALREVCWTHHGRIQPDQPPADDVPDDCTPAYDGSWTLPKHRPPPRVDAAAFWAAEGVQTRTLANGEIVPVDSAERQRVFTRYAPQPGRTGGRPRPPR